MKFISIGTCDFCGKRKPVAQSPNERAPGTRVWPYVCIACAKECVDLIITRFEPEPGRKKRART